jgi:alkylation response protein AidB-like acyl-CoA dehydrogenase
MFADAIQSLLDAHGTPAQVRAIETGASAQPLAQALAEAGFLDLLAPEERGGGAVGWREFFEVVALLGAWAVPLPVAQTMAARLVADEELPGGFITFASSVAAAPGRGLLAANVPFGRTADHVIASVAGSLVLLDVADAKVESTGVHASVAASMRWTHPGRPLRSGVSSDRFEAMAALLHAGLLAGAIKRCFDLTLAYANDRVQFGKSIGKFQAIQHQLAVMAEHAAAARMAAEAAFATAGVWPAREACAVAKARTSEAAQLVASIAHAVHGAIGVTEEYDLQLFTRRLHEWRVAHGSESYWHRQLGLLVLSSPEPLIADLARSLHGATE